MQTCSENNGDLILKTIEFNRDNFDNLVKQNAELMEVLQGIINHCVHPEIAVRSVMVDLAPLRKVIKKNQELFDT